MNHGKSWTGSIVPPAAVAEPLKEDTRLFSCLRCDTITCWLVKGILCFHCHHDLTVLMQTKGRRYNL